MEQLQEICWAYIDLYKLVKQNIARRISGGTPDETTLVRWKYIEHPKDNQELLGYDYKKLKLVMFTYMMVILHEHIYNPASNNIKGQNKIVMQAFKDYKKSKA